MAINACYVIEFFSALHERIIIKSTYLLGFNCFNIGDLGFAE